MALAYVIYEDKYISIACFEDDEYWTGNHKHNIGEDCRVATDNEVSVWQEACKAEMKAINDFEKSFGITIHGPKGRAKQPKEYAAMYAAYARGEGPKS
jgi:hypothetical protein